ncbi:MAG: glycosyltransferase [Oscillospiraceae bacterium]
MRIAIFVDTYSPYINGVVTHVKVLKEGLEKTGHKVLIVTAKNKIRHHYIENDILFCPSVGFKHLYDYGLASPISRTRIKHLKKFQPDIIHIHQEFGVGLSGVLAAKSLDIPIVYTLHTMYDEYLYYLMPKKLMPLAKKVMRKYAKFFAKRASSLTGPSRKVDEYFKLCGIDKQVNIVPNPVEIDLFCKNKSIVEKGQLLKQNLNITNDKKILVFCGRLGHEKNLILLFDIFKKVVESNSIYHLLILGDSPIKDEFIKYTMDINISENVTFVGQIEHEILPPYYAMSFMYITASMSDTNSISMLEAMSMGLPVLHIEDPLNQGQVEHGVNGYIFKNAEDVIRYLEDFSNKTQEEKDTMVSSTINIVKRLGSDTLAQTLLSIYSKCF